MLSVVILNVIMLNVIVLSVDMLSVMAPKIGVDFAQHFWSKFTQLLLVS
jgi:hypothetical protein